MKKQYWLALAVIFILAAVFAVFYGRSEKALAPVSRSPVLAAPPATLVVTSPKAGDVIQSPLIIKGTAKGMWYFEATFPVKIVDANGNVVGQSQARAESDWMTENFVPFSGSIPFTAKEGEKGEVVFAKDNPSGLPQNAEEFRVPIVFGKEM